MRAEDKQKKGLWSEEEDRVLLEHIQVHGIGKWNRIPKLTGLKRCGKSCRLRWLNYLSPNVKRGCFSEEEDDLIIRLHKLLGNRWSLIAGRVPGRTDNQVKNYWNSHLSKKLGITTTNSPRRIILNQVNNQIIPTNDNNSDNLSKTNVMEGVKERECHDNNCSSCIVHKPVQEEFEPARIMNEVGDNIFLDSPLIVGDDINCDYFYNYEDYCIVESLNGNCLDLDDEQMYWQLF